METFKREILLRGPVLILSFTRTSARVIVWVFNYLFIVRRQTVLKEIRTWLDAHPKEIVILSFSHFQGLNQELHTLLISTIKSVFNSKLCPKMVRSSPPCPYERWCRTMCCHRIRASFQPSALLHHIEFAQNCEKHSLVALHQAHT